MPWVLLSELTKRFVVLSILSAILTGCTGFHLHDSADEQLAKKTQDSFKSADIIGFIDSERKALAIANERDVAVVKRNMQAQRDALIVMPWRGRRPGRRWSPSLKVVLRTKESKIFLIQKRFKPSRDCGRQLFQLERRMFRPQ